MWRRVALQSPDQPGSGLEAYKMAYAAISDLLNGGHSISGHERNSLFLNCGVDKNGALGRFANASIATGFALDDDTRASATVDWYGDGALDFWLNNRTSPRLRFFRNTLPAGAAWLAVKVEGTTCNRDAIGARLELTLPSGRKLFGARRCGEGFLSQNSAWVHFGFAGEKPGPVQLTVHWPDGKAELFKDLASGQRWVVKQGAAAPRVAPPIPPTSLATASVASVPLESKSRLVIVWRLPLPEYASVPIQPDAMPSKEASKGTLLVFFASWCAPCAVELAALAKQEPQLRAQGLDVKALNVDELSDQPTSKDFEKSKNLLSKVRWPFAAVALDPENAGALDVFHRSYMTLRRPLPVPSSFLLDAQGRVAVIYRGPVEPSQVLADAKLLPLPAEQVRATALPFSGRWETVLAGPNPSGLVVTWKREGCLKVGAAWLERYLAAAESGDASTAELSPQVKVNLYEHLADFRHLLKDEAGYAAVYQRLLKIAPDYEPAHTALGLYLGKANRGSEAMVHLERAAALAPGDAQVLSNLAIGRSMQGRKDEALALFRRAAEINPNLIIARLNMARLYAQRGEWSEAELEMRAVWRVQPGYPGMDVLFQMVLPRLPTDRQAEAAAFFNLKKSG